MLFDHDDLKKTRRAVIVISVLMILANSYLSEVSDVSIVGLKFSLDRESVLNGLSIGFAYLWWMLLWHSIREVIPKFLEIQKDKTVKKKNIEIYVANLSHEAQVERDYMLEDAGPYSEGDAISDEKNKIIQQSDKFVKNIRLGVMIAANILPPLVVSLVVGYKFDILQRVNKSVGSFLGFS